MELHGNLAARTECFEVRYSRWYAFFVSSAIVAIVAAMSFAVHRSFTHGETRLGWAILFLQASCSIFLLNVGYHALQALVTANPLIHMNHAGLQIQHRRIPWAAVVGCRPYPFGRIAVKVAAGSISRWRLRMDGDPDEWGADSTQEERRRMRNLLVVVVLFGRPGASEIIEEINRRCEEIQ